MKSKLPCFTCGQELSKMNADKRHDHQLLHKRDEIIAAYPVLLEIDKEIGEKYGAEIKVFFPPQKEKSGKHK